MTLMRALRSSILLPQLLQGLLMISGSFAAEQVPWEMPRNLSAFESLLKRSPFTLPTAEESSPLSERFAMTGIASIAGEDQVFVFDRTDQSRFMLTAKPNEKNMSLVSIVRQDSSPLKASIRVGNETGTIGFLEAAQQPTQQQAPPAPGSPAAAALPAGQQAVKLPPLPPLPQLPAGANAPGRRIIRRPVVAPPQQAQPTP
jgi:hypothetical protein